MKLVFISDTHCQLNKVIVPEGDILIHSGDLTYQGTLREVSTELKILRDKTPNFKHRLLICGNHDRLGEKNESLMRQLCAENNITYLQNESVVIDGIKFYGAPQQPEFFNWAFNVPRGASIKRYWDAIPDDTNVLITHGPPFGILDMITPVNLKGHLGCEELYKRVIRLPNLKFHAFGHIHGNYGVRTIFNTTFINASICKENYAPLNSPITIEL